MIEHAKLSPSGATRWMNCPGSIQLCQFVPKKPGSKYANEGTAAHYLADWCATRGARATTRLGDTINVKTEEGQLAGFPVTEEMADAVQVYLDHISFLIDKHKCPGMETHFEKKLDLTAWIPGGFGTSDFYLVTPLDELIVVDYKHGAGVAVNVEDNAQMKIYALGALGAHNDKGVQSVTYTIVQPRAPHSQGIIRSETISAAELLAWGDRVLKTAAREALNPLAPFQAGTWCRWCDGLERCPEVSRNAAQEMFGTPNLPEVSSAEKPVLPDVKAMDPAQLAKVYRIVDEYLDHWIKAVKAAFYFHLKNNGPCEGYKLVSGRSSRSWKDELTAELELGEILGDDAYEEPKFKSPAQAEAALKKIGQKYTTIAHLVQVKRGDVVAPLDDPRPALPSAVEDMFSVAPPEEEEAK